MRRPLDIVAMVRATDRAAGSIERLRETVHRIDGDTERTARIADCRCKYCYYARGNIGGASITPFDCGICGATHSSPSTDTDVVCRDCARAHSLCRRCGGDFETRERRRKWPVGRSQSNL